MYSDKNLAYVLTILESIEKIFLYTSGFSTPEEFYEANDQLNFNGTYNLLIVEGEESKKIDLLLKREFSQIPWRKIADLRNHLVHEYRGTDPGILFDIVQNYLIDLKSALIDMLAKINYDKKQFTEIVKSKHFSHIQYLLLKK
jgi:uncharacterized protein with HEPN domain